MATVTSFTAARLLEIEASSIVDGTINEFGHLILTRNDGATIDAGYALAVIPNASDTQKGIVELATIGEVTAGTDNSRAVTPASLKDGLVLPTASDTQKGIVELASSGETSTGTDATRAVTPAGLAPTVSGINSSINGLDARIDTLEAIPGDKVRSLTDNSIAESAIPTNIYPLGISMMSIASGFWPSFPSGFGMVVTYYRNDARCYQEYHRHQENAYWKRTYNSQIGWTSWTPVVGNIVTARISITPVANAPTSTTWSYGKTLPSPVFTQATVNTTVIGQTVLHGAAVSSVGTTSSLVWVYRTNTVSTNVDVMAVGGL